MMSWCITSFLFAIGVFLAFDLSSSHRLIALDDADADDRNGNLASSRAKRSHHPHVDPKNRVTVSALNDSHNTLDVHWAGEGSDVIIALAKNREQRSAALFVSEDYGKTFTYVSDRMMVDQSETQAVLLDFYIVENYNNIIIFTDVDKKCIFTSDDTARNFMRHCYLPFKPRTVKINPADPSFVLAMDEESSMKRLYLSEDFGEHWRPIYSRVKAFHWGVRPYDNATTIYILEERYDGSKQVVRSHTFFSNPFDTEVLMSDVQAFEINDIYLYAIKSVRLLGSSHNPHLQFWVSYNRGKMVKGEFPGNLNITGYVVADASEGQLMVMAIINNSYCNLYISEVAGFLFSFSLERIACFNPKGNNLPDSLRDTEAFADLVKIHGVNGIYIASQEMKDQNLKQRTLITYDKGGEWQLISAPEYTVGNRPSNCDKNLNCSLHLMQKFNKNYEDTRSLPILTQESAPGLVIASGGMGQSLRDDPDVFISATAGITWRQVLSGNYFYSTGDHGGIIVAVHQYSPTDEVIYSIDEGETWHSYRIIEYKIRVYGLLTEPGENTTVFSVFGSPLTEHSWLVLQIDFQNVFEGVNCTENDYKMWSVEKELPNGDGCLLGHITEYQRRIAHARCYNGRDFVREVQTKNCFCTREDFECDFGFKERRAICIRDEDTDDSRINSVPSPCPEGTFYSYSRGYRKVAGDTCKGGDEHKYGPLQYSCPIEERNDFLLLTRDNQVLMVNLATKARFTLFEEDLAHIPVAFDYKMFCVIYIDSSSRIKKKCFSEDRTTQQSDEVIRGKRDNSTVSYLAFDWTGRNIYFTSSHRNEIRVLSVNGTFEKLLYKESQGAHKPRAMVVDPHHGYLYFVGATSKNNFAIFQASMDGKGTVEIKVNSSFVSEDTSLALDLENERLYWTTPSLLKVFMADLEHFSVNQSHAFNHFGGYPSGIGVFKNYLYVSNQNGYLPILTFDRHTLTQLSDFESIDTVYGLVVVSSTSQHAKSPCSDYNTRCSQLCLPRPNPEDSDPQNRTCVCGEGYRFSIQPGSGDQTCMCEDGEVQAEDGTCHEANSTSTCATDKLTCRNGNCVMMSWKCDGDDDCRDGTDELDCPYTTCNSNSFTCKTGKCIPQHWQCDREDDCKDGFASDEARCARQNCSKSQFQCKNGYCIDKNWVCDGDNDCHDNSDEANCTQTSCHPWEFTCKSGMCVDATFRCNSHNDCDDGSDEGNCTHSLCTSWQFSCGDDQCIFENWRCDGDKDCDNNADEQNCTRAFTTTTSLPQLCSSSFQHRCSDGSCVGWEDVCNGVRDCADGSDETGCWDMATTPTPTFGPCGEWEFRCQSGGCIDGYDRCNGVEDCSDGTDEERCESSCPSYQYQCEVGNYSTGINCIRKEWVCDGEEDCPDGDDERDDNCFDHPATCDGFLCGSDECIRMSKRCDGRPDCNDGSDESGCYSAGYRKGMNCSHFDMSQSECCAERACGVYLSYGSDYGSGGFCLNITNAGSRTRANKCSGYLSGYSCEPDQFNCQDSKMTCVSFTQRCNKREDCLTGRDEDNCPDCAYSLESEVFLDSKTNTSVTWTLNFVKGQISYAEEIPGLPRTNWTWRNQSLSNESPKVEGLKAATQYIFVFYALLNQSSTLCFIHEFAVTTNDGLPSKPTHLTLRVHEEHNPLTYIVDVMWKESEVPNGVITEYVIYYQQISAEGKALTRVFSKRKNIGAVRRTNGYDYKTHVVEHIEASKTYDFWVVAKTRSGGEGSPSDKKKVVIKALPSTDLHVSVAGITESGLTVKWSKDKEAESYKVSLHFLEDMRQGFEFSGAQIPDASKVVNTTSVKFTDLCPGSVIKVEVQAMYPDKRFGLVWKPGHLHDVQLKGAVPNVTLTSLEKTGPTSVFLHYSGVAGKNKMYHIYYTHDQNKDPMYHTSLESSHELVGLLACEHYFVWVRPVSKFCPVTHMKDFVTEEDPLAPPKHLAAHVVRNKDLYSLNLTWNAMCFSISEPTNYIIRMQLGNKPPQYVQTPKRTNATHLSHFFPHVQSGVVYNFTVRSNMAGSQESPYYSVRIPHLDGPTNVVVKWGQNNTVSIQWEWPLAKEAEDFKEYVVYTRGANVSLKNHTIKTHIKLKLPRQGSYTFQVVAMTKSDEKLAESEEEDYIYEYEAPNSAANSADDDSHISKTNLVAILVPVAVVVVGLSAGLVFFIVRHKRLQRSFLAFANSHYNIQSGTTTFSDELDGDEPMIQGFSDDEPLVIA